MSFDIALSGIQAVNESLEQTSHNIANAGTYGFKSSRANFSAMLAGDRATGATIGSISQSVGLSGGVLNTGRALDAAINGRGFFVTRTANDEIQYTRVGIFNPSVDGFLEDASGRRVQGFAMKPPSTILGAQGDLSIPTGQIPAVASTKIAYVGNFSADWLEPNATTAPWVSPVAATATTPAVIADPASFNMSKASIVYDTVGAQHTLTQYFVSQSTTAAGTGTVQVKYVLDGTEVTAAASSLILDPLTGQLSSPATGIVPVDLSAVTLPTGAKLNIINIDYTGSTGFAGEATTTANTWDGYASGVFSKVELTADGSVVAKYSNGQSQTVGKLALATFANEGALKNVNDTSWTATVESGAALTGTPGSGMAGNLNTNSLEQSNVDITSELVGLMTSQRNYQANSKVIQTESTMLQSLMQAI